MASSSSPHILSFCCLIATFLTWTNSSHSNVITPSCSAEENVCEFWLTLSNMKTMSDRGSTFLDPFHPIVYRKETFMKLLKTGCAESPLEGPEWDRVVTGDGTYKTLQVYNKSMPGPPLVVYQGQQVVVHLKNELLGEGTTLHFHGLHMRNTPWMDGAGSISQCAIHPHESFTYRFLADVPGTYWYHSHHATQRTNGAYGALVILDRQKADEDERRGPAYALPDFAAEFSLIVSDFLTEDSRSTLLEIKQEAVSFAFGYDIEDEMCYASTKQADGLDCGVVPFQAGVINGKTRDYPRRLASRNGEDNPFSVRSNETNEMPLPLETFFVKKVLPGSTTTFPRYRFRMVCASMSFGFRVSIDSHPLHIISTDGSDVRLQDEDEGSSVAGAVHSIIVFPGERVDFWIEASDPANLGSYWIHAENLEYKLNGQRIDPGFTRAILFYGDNVLVPGEQVKDPVSEQVNCRKSNCKLINCGFEKYPPHMNITCIPLSTLHSASATPAPMVEPQQGEEIKEIFLNFHFAHNGHTWKSSVNGIEHVPPAAPPQVYPFLDQQLITPCDSDHCTLDAGGNNAYCLCTHQIDIPLGTTVQMVLMTTVLNPSGVYNGNLHQIHLHGQHFQVLKTGFPTYTSAGVFNQTSSDLECMDTFCNKVRWSNASWRDGGEIPGMNTESPIQKDTISVPVGGYIIIRFKADNPGYWFMHCHTQFHSEDGMALYLKVGNDSDMNAPPSHMTSCGNFDWSEEEFNDKVNFPVSPEFVSALTCAESLALYRITSVVFASTTLLLLGTCIIVFIRLRQQTTTYTMIRDAGDGGTTFYSTSYQVQTTTPESSTPEEQWLLEQQQTVQQQSKYEGLEAVRKNQPRKKYRLKKTDRKTYDGTETM